jgi:predicted esterase
VAHGYSSQTNDQDLVVIPLSVSQALPNSIHTALKPKDETWLLAMASNYFASPPERRLEWKFPRRANTLLRDNEAAVRRAVWTAYREAPIHAGLQQDYEAKQARFEKHLSPYTVKAVGRKPAQGWPLFIAMHGGGNAPKRLNDSQWAVMQRYYRDQSSVPGYLYVALRAPNDTWNGFYDDYVYPLVANLIRQFVLFAEVDPNKVFIMGYSHGGYGAFAIGPKMPDRFAAVHASAAAPTDGETSAKTLRTTPFTYMIGEKDSAYGRLERCKAFDEKIRKLRGARTDIYPVSMEFKAGFGHGGLPDRDKIKDLYPAIRNPVPAEISWEMTDRVIRDFYWIRVAEPGKGGELTAVCRNNTITVTSTNVTAASLLLDGRLVDFRKPVRVELNGRLTTRKPRPSLATLCETMLERGDPDLAFTAKVDLDFRH